MTETKKVYVVTGGEYSDYHIIGVFSSEESAKRTLELSGGRLEEYELDVRPNMPDGYEMFKGEVTKGGDTKIEGMGILEANEPMWAEFSPKFIGGIREIYEVCLYLRNVLAHNKEHAAKIANEKKAYVIAAFGWPKDKEELDAWKNAGRLPKNLLEKIS